MRFIKIIFLALIVSFCLVPFVVCSDDSDGANNPYDPNNPHRPPTSGTAGDNVKWSYGGSTVTFTVNDPDKEGVMSDYSVSSLPTWVTYYAGCTTYRFGEGITYIGAYSLNGTSATTIELPSTLKGIGDFAFMRTGITSIDLPDGLESIGQSAFQRTSLTSVVLPDSVTSVGTNAFAFCVSMTEAKIGSGLVDIPQGMFSNTTSLLDLVLGDNVQSIGRYFLSGSSLQSLHLTKNVAVIHNRAFSGYTKDSLSEITVDPANGYFSSEGGVLYNHDRSELVRALPTWAVGDYEIPSGVSSVGAYAFYLCDDMTSIKIPDTVTYIGSSAFGGCSGLTELTVPDSVVKLAAGSIDTGSPLQKLSIGNGIDRLLGSQVPALSTVRSLYIGSGVSMIEYSVLRTNPNLESVTADSLSPHYTTLSGVLYNRSVTQLLLFPSKYAGTFYMPNSVTYLGDYIFRNLPVEDIVLSTSLHSIGKECFAGSSLKIIKIPASVKIIGDGAFKGCSDLVQVYFEGDSIPSIGQEAFAVRDYGQEPLRVYSPLKEGFLDAYMGNLSADYRSSDEVYTSLEDRLLSNTFLMVLLLICVVFAYGGFLYVRAHIKRNE